jgi:hypothetical protein
MNVDKSLYGQFAVNAYAAYNSQYSSLWAADFTDPYLVAWDGNDSIAANTTYYVDFIGIEPGVFAVANQYSI